MIEIKGIAWDHPRGYEPLIAVSEQFEKSNPKVSIKWDVRSLKEFGDMPIEDLIECYDLITIDHPYMGQADKNGLLLKLEEHIPEYRLKKLEAESLGQCFNIYRYNSHMYAMPIDAAALVASFRKDLIEAAGLSLPRTQDELKSFYKKLPGGFSVAWALCPTDIWCTFLTLCAQNAGRNFIGEKQIDGKVGAEAIDEIKFHLEYLHPSSMKWSPIHVLDRMGNEDEIIYSPYLFGYTNYSRNGYTRNLIQFTNSPVGTIEYISTIMGGVGLAVSSLTKNPSIAAKFAEYAAAAEIQEGIFTQRGGQPANAKAWQSAENDRLCSGFFSSTIWSIENAYIRPQHPGWNQFQEQGADVIHEGILKNRCSNQVMRQLNELYQSICL